MHTLMNTSYFVQDENKFLPVCIIGDSFKTPEWMQKLKEYLIQRNQKINPT